MTGGAGGGSGGAGGGAGWVKGSIVVACLFAKGDSAEEKGAEPLCDRAGELAFGSCAFMAGMKSAGRGGGVGGAGVGVREHVGGKADRSKVRASHSLVTACRSCLLKGGWGESRA